MIENLLNEYVSCAEEAASVDYLDRKAIRRFNKSSDRMRAIVAEVVSMGDQSVLDFARVLDIEPAFLWAAHHLVEMADLDSSTLAKCFARVEESKVEAERESRMADAMGEEMWLNEWQKKTM